MTSKSDMTPIDSPQISSEISPIKEMILWWEKRRIIYNILIVGLSIFLIYNFWDYPMRMIIGGNKIILDGVILTLVLNAFYTLAWIFGALSHVLFKTGGSINALRWVLFILGTLFSLIMINFFYVFAFDVLFAN